MRYNYDPQSFLNLFVFPFSILKFRYRMMMLGDLENILELSYEFNELTPSDSLEVSYSFNDVKPSYSLELSNDLNELKPSEYLEVSYDFNDVKPSDRLEVSYEFMGQQAVTSIQIHNMTFFFHHERK